MSDSFSFFPSSCVSSISRISRTLLGVLARTSSSRGTAGKKKPCNLVAHSALNTNATNAPRLTAVVSGPVNDWLLRASSPGSQRRRPQTVRDSRSDRRGRAGRRSHSATATTRREGSSLRFEKSGSNRLHTFAWDNMRARTHAHSRNSVLSLPRKK